MKLFRLERDDSSLNRQRVHRLDEYLCATMKPETKIVLFLFVSFYMIRNIANADAVGISFDDIVLYTVLVKQEHSLLPVPAAFQTKTVSSSHGLCKFSFN